MKSSRLLIRIILVSCVIIMIFAAASAENGIFPFPVNGLFVSGNDVPYTAVLSSHVRKLMPFGDERTEQLDRLLKHLSLRLSDDGEKQLIAFSVDGTDVLSFIRKAGENGPLTAVIPVSKDIYTGELLPTTDDDLISELLYGITGKEHQYLESALRLIGSIPAEYPELCTESRISSNIKGFGIVKKKKTITIGENDAETFAGHLADKCDTDGLSDLIRSVAFYGKQNFRLMYDETDALIKMIFDGHVTDSDGNRRNVSLVWQHCEGDITRNKLTLKTPRNDGKGRNNVVVDESIRQEGNIYHWDGDLIYEEVLQGTKSVTEVQTDVTGETSEALTTLNGNIIISNSQNGKARGRTELGIDAEIGNGSTGTLTIRTYRSNDLIEDADVIFALDRDARIPEPESDKSIVTDAGTRTELMSEASACLIRAFVKLPREDTLFISGDLTDDIWQRITEAAGMLPKEESN